MLFTSVKYWHVSDQFWMQTEWQFLSFKEGSYVIIWDIFRDYLVFFSFKCLNLSIYFFKGLIFNIIHILKTSTESIGSLTSHRFSTIGLMLKSFTNPKSWYICSKQLSIWKKGKLFSYDYHWSILKIVCTLHINSERETLFKSILFHKGSWEALASQDDLQDRCASPERGKTRPQPGYFGLVKEHSCSPNLNQVLTHLRNEFPD